MATKQATTTTASLPHLRAPPRTGTVLGLDSPSPPPSIRSHVTVPFLWEDAPGKPKVRGGRRLSGRPATTTVVVSHAVVDTAMAGGVEEKDGGGTTAACHVPMKLKLPPRLQVAATAECSLSPETVLQGPYCGGGGGRKPPRPLRRSGSTAGFRRKLGAAAAGGFFSWTKAGRASGRKKDGFLDVDASPSASSSSSMPYCFFDDDDDDGRGAHRREGDGRGGSEEVEVRIRRLRRNRSLPSMTTWHLLANIRRSVRQINPWS